MWGPAFFFLLLIAVICVFVILCREASQLRKAILQSKVAKERMICKAI